MLYQLVKALYLSIELVSSMLLKYTILFNRNKIRRIEPHRHGAIRSSAISAMADQKLQQPLLC